MANFLEEYAEYFKNFQEFVAKLNYEDDLLPSNLKCRTGQEELVGECVEWTLRYLRLTKCPQSLLAFLTKTALDRVKLKNDEYTQEGVLAPNMVEIVNEVCLQYCGNDNPALNTLPAPPSVPTPVVSTCAIKNSRRRMENRHAIVEDLDVIFNISTSRPTNYYGLFDGHSGVDAATYCSTHMHCFIAQSPKYPSDPEGALRDAFARTELLFTEKCNQENINGGCTALCVLHRPLDHQLYVAWVGDSQAIIVSQKKILRLVNPHKPERKDEQKRIEQAGGVVLFYGTWRVNGQLAVSRAIGDIQHKPFVSGVPEITSVTLEGDEDFLVLGCDGLWDSVKEAEVAATLYEQFQNEPGDDSSSFSQSVVSLARRAGSRDNISVLVVLLRPAGRIAQGAGESVDLCNKEVVAAYGRPDGAHMDILDSVDNANNPFLPTNGLRDEASLMFDNSPVEEEQGARLQLKEAAATDDDEEDDDDLGPETDVDAVDDDVDDVDDVLVSPMTHDAVSNPFLEKTSLDKHEVLALAMGKELPTPDVADLAHGWLGHPTGAAELSAELGAELSAELSADDDQPASLEPLEPLTSSQLAKGGAEDNVGESGEESEDEWNYYRVEPTGDKESGPQNPDCGDSEEMESQLNPNAAVFIPSPPAENSNHIEQPFNENLTQEEFFNKEDVMSSSFIAHDPVPAIISMPVEDLNGKDEVWLSSSPKKGGVPLDNVNVPPEDEFDREVSQRPGDLDVESPLNETNGSDTVFESVKNNKNILEDVCNFENAIQNGIEESVTNAESLNPFNLSKPQDVCAVQELQVSENGNKDALDLCPTEQVESNVNAELTEVEDEMRYEIGAINPLEPSSPLEPANFLQHDLLEPVNSDIFVSDAVPDQLQPQDNCNLLDAEKISSIDVQLLEPGKTDGPPEDLDEVKGNTLEPLTTVTENTSPVEEVPISDLMEQKAFTITVENPEKNFTEISAVVEDNFEHSSEQLETSKPNDSDLLNEVDVSNGNLQVCKPSENADSQSPIVAGASDFTREHFSDNTFTAPSFSQNISNIEKATGALDDAVLYSNSGFESMMDAPPATSPASHISAQSTPFDGPAFEFEHVEKALTEQEPVLDSMRQDKLDIFYQESGDTKLQFHSQNETSDFNKGFAEDSQFGAVDSVTEPESSPAKEIVDLTTEELSQIPDQISSKPDVLPEENVLDISESVDPSADHDANIETVESPESLQSGHVDLAYNANVPDVCEFPKEETVHLAENGSVTQDLVNGIEESVGTAPLPVSETVVEPAVLVESNVVPEIPTVDLDDSKVAVAEIPVVDLDVSEVAIAEPGLENNPESDSCNKLAAVAAVGAAAGAAAITVAAGVAAVSKTDKKTTSKAPTKAKPLPAAKAPIKTTTSKPSTTISATAPKKPAASPVPAARAAPKTATAAAKPAATAPKPTAAAPRTTVTAPRTTATSKPKPSEVANKTAATTKPAQPKPRVTPATRPLAEKKPLTNGDASKPAAAKPLTRPPTRPATAPARTTSKPLSSTTTAPTSKASVPTAAPRPVPARKVPTTLAAPKPKSAPTVSEAKPKTTTAAGIAARPRPATASSTTKSTLLSTKVPPSKPIDKQTKESTNKLISATRTTVSRTTASKTTASKTSASTNGTTAKATSVSSKPQPIRKPTTATTTGSAKGAVEKKSSENPTAPITNGVMKNGHATPDEKPVQNGVHDEPVIDKRESDLKIESLVDNQLVA